MHKLAVGVLIFITGWGLGWYTYHHWGTDPVPSAQPAIPVPSEPVNPEAATVLPPTAPGYGDDMASLLQRNEFEALLERYESLQVQSDDTAVADARTRILSHARLLIENRRFNVAEQLLQRFLVAAYRDVEARILLAAAYRGQEDYYAAIDQLYEARGYAYRPAMLQRITTRIRSMVAELTQSLKASEDQNALLALYQHLVQLEPDHAPWFMGLATTQLALEDKAAARRSLLLVSQDPGVGAQAQALLSELDPALTEMQDAASWDATAEVVGIPLHRSGNHFIVDARPARAHSIRLLIDTGASLTIFTPAVLEQRGIRYQDTGRTGVFNTANGRIRAPIYTLDSLSVGDWYVNSLEIGVLELGSRSGVDGLLGMNFLNHFQFFIDQNEAMLRLSAN
jgi:clan AA aspartic protease (TIGR02281 family)